MVQLEPVSLNNYNSFGKRMSLADSVKHAELKRRNKERGVKPAHHLSVNMWDKMHQRKLS